MNSKFLTLVTVALLFSSISFAKILRVAYKGIPVSGVDFEDFQPAHDAAKAGDTLQIYGGGVSGTVSKKLVIVGFGYNFDVNKGLQAIGTDAPSLFNQLRLGVGSNGTLISGVMGSFQIGDGADETPISDITFQRCRGDFLFNNYEAYGIISNIKFISCVLMCYTNYSSNGNPVINLQLNNCIIDDLYMYNNASTIIVLNCVTRVGISINLNNAGAIVKNSIIGTSNSTANINTVYESCFFGDAQPDVLPAGSNNRWGQDWGVIFNRLGGSDDSPGSNNDPSFTENYYILKAGSPAINGGFNNANAPTNCGIYGGEAAYIYKLSGVPAVPSIYKLTAPGTSASANPYNITISVRSNN